MIGIASAGSFATKELAAECIYVEQARSGRARGQKRPLFEQMKRDAVLHRFDRLLVWKVSRLGRDMREVIDTVYELADLGVTVVPVKSQTGPISSMMGKLLWAIQAWFAEFENDDVLSHRPLPLATTNRPHSIFTKRSLL